ncbi:MAG: sulfurtransferase-like selenium metabolism protein YedF [Deltaproteobacteria bacterium]|nr:MAG: sulfurtransferase-like selenium metabolism protein YedF [Deltaproteobacteria bacterium]
MKTIDACGLDCPGPVLLVKNTLEQENTFSRLTVLVDNPGSQENVSRFLCTKGYSVKTRNENGIFSMEASLGVEKDQTKSQQLQQNREYQPAKTPQKVMVLISSDTMGAGDNQLGKKLMASYLKTLREMGPELWHLVFVNSGVRLTTKNSPVLATLQACEQDGVIVLACGTCLEHFQLLADKRVGATTNMLDIVTAMQLADKVITIG